MIYRLSCMFAGGHEPLLDDTTRFAQRARLAGVVVTLRVSEGLFHCSPICALMFPEATSALTEICAFARRAVGLAEGAG